MNSPECKSKRLHQSKVLFDDSRRFSQ